ncbi:unnamed protein product, partial [Mesorhabditis spiculigera]
MGDEPCRTRFLLAQTTSIVLLCFTILLFIVLAITTIRLRRAFHPFFSFYFSSLVILYIICMMAIVLCKVWSMTGYDGPLSTVNTYILTISYYLISPINSMIVLYFFNKSITLKLLKSGGASLTLRYQLAENIKAMRAVIPFLICDNFITWNDQLFDILFGVDYLVPTDSCAEDTKFYLFLLTTLIRTVLSYIQPGYILYQHDLFRKKFLALFGKNAGINVFATRRTQPTSKLRKLNNVLGAEIKLAVSQQEYFDIIKSYW